MNTSFGKDPMNPFTFIAGVGLLLTSGISSVFESNKQEIKNQAYLSGHHNMHVQINDYDGNRSRLLDAYDHEMVVSEIHRYYPNMADCVAYDIAYTAIAQKMMEDETQYKYVIPEKYEFLGDLKRFVKDEFRK